MSSRFSVDRFIQQPRLIWAFWVAAGLAAVGGVFPLLLGGPSSRIVNAFIPFTVAAVALGACAVLHDRGRALNGTLYFVAGLALIFGVLTMSAFALELSVAGSCAAAPAPCAPGLQRPLTVAENTAIALAAGFAFASIVVGFLGLMIVFRRRIPTPTAPPVRTIPPVASSRRTSPVAVGATQPSHANGAKPVAHQPELELPAHEEPDLPELPPHESNPPTT